MIFKIEIIAAVAPVVNKIEPVAVTHHSATTIAASEQVSDF